MSQLGFVNVKGPPKPPLPFELFKVVLKNIVAITLTIASVPWLPPPLPQFESHFFARGVLLTNSSYSQICDSLLTNRRGVIQSRYSSSKRAP